MYTLIDTNVFLHFDFEEICTNQVTPCVTTGVLAELDSMKNGVHRHTVQKALFFIEHSNMRLCNDTDAKTVDDGLLDAAWVNDFQIMTNDRVVRIKARQFGIPVIQPTYEKEEYSGYISVTLDNTMSMALYESILQEHATVSNPYKLLPNEYIQFVDEQHTLIDVFRYTEKGYKRLQETDSITAWNIEQRMAIDALLIDTPIKIIVGTYGSAKTFLSTTIGYESVQAKNKLVLIRNADTGSESAEQIGYLPGDKYDKTRSLFMPMAQYLPMGEETLIKDMLQNKIETYITSEIKGVTLENSFIIMDEAEDCTLNVLKRVGSRLGRNSKIVFTGDCKQTEGRFQEQSGLENLINLLKDNELVSIVRLATDVRSEGSKVFSTL